MPAEARKAAPGAASALAETRPPRAEAKETGRKAKREAAEPAPVSLGEPLLPPAPPVAQGGEPRPSGDVDRGKPIPDTYGMDRLVALVRDPQWVFCYWELAGELLKNLRKLRGGDFVDGCAWVLRLHRIRESLAVDVEVEASAGNWYIHVGKPGVYQVELGLLSPEGEFVSLLASQVVETPAESPSDRVDEEWGQKASDELYRRLLKELGLAEDARKRGVSGFVGASGLVSSWPAASWRLPGSFLGASGAWSGAVGGASGALGGASMLGASESGRPVSGAWVSSFLGASGQPTSRGSGGLMAVGWIVGADGRHEPVLLRPSPGGGPNWHLQPYLPGRREMSGFKVKLPRVVHGAARPEPGWPQPFGGVGTANVPTHSDVPPAIVPWAHPAPVPRAEPETAPGAREHQARRARPRPGSRSRKK